MKKPLVPALALLMLFIVAPVMAKPIGPRNAEKNPNIMFELGATILHTPGGVQNEWRDTDEGVMDLLHLLNASNHKIRSALTPTFNELKTIFANPTVALQFENKWIYVSHNDLFELLLLLGLPNEMAEAIAAMWPDGMYMMFVNVGK